MYGSREDGGNDSALHGGVHACKNLVASGGGKTQVAKFGGTTVGDGGVRTGTRTRYVERTEGLS